MKKQLLFFFIALSLLISVATFANQSNTIYSEDKLNIVVDARHPTFTIQLKSNPTTGFSWFLRDYDKALIVPVNHHFQAPSDKKLLGAPGHETWTFKVLPAGFAVPHQTSIRFLYARPWQGADNATEVVFWVSTAGK